MRENQGLLRFLGVDVKRRALTAVVAVTVAPALLTSMVKPGYAAGFVDGVATAYLMLMPAVMAFVLYHCAMVMMRLRREGEPVRSSNGATLRLVYGATTLVGIFAGHILMKTF